MEATKPWSASAAERAKPAPPHENGSRSIASAGAEKWRLSFDATVASTSRSCFSNGFFVYEGGSDLVRKLGLAVEYVLARRRATWAGTTEDLRSLSGAF